MNIGTKPASRNSIVSADQVRWHLFHVAESGVALEDVLSGCYWAHIRSDMVRRPWALIECVSATGEWECILRIESGVHDASKDRAEVVVRPLVTWQANRGLEDLPNEYNVQYDEFRRTWALVRLGHGLVEDGIASEAEARRIAQHHRFEWELRHGVGEGPSEASPSADPAEPPPSPSNIAARRGRPPADIEI